MALIEPKKLITIMFFILETLISRAMSSTFPESLLSERYELWLAQYGRKHVNSEEQEKRFYIFKDNVEYIDKFNNEGNRTFKLGANKFADLTHEEFLATYNRNKISTLPSSINVKSFDFNAITEIPNTLDWRERGAVTSVKDQGWGCSKRITVPKTLSISLLIIIIKIFDFVVDSYACSCIRLGLFNSRRNRRVTP